ncbi:MAG: hypothetical protein WBA93_05340 [Microcoleaceae cyanobacterium]
MRKWGMRKRSLLRRQKGVGKSHITGLYHVRLISDRQTFPSLYLHFSPA